MQPQLKETSPMPDKKRAIGKEKGDPDVYIFVYVMISNIYSVDSKSFLLRNVTFWDVPEGGIYKCIA
jgi:hypothetical protein